MICFSKSNLVFIQGMDKTLLFQGIRIGNEKTNQAFNHAFAVHR